MSAYHIVRHHRGPAERSHDSNDTIDGRSKRLRVRTKPVGRDFLRSRNANETASVGDTSEDLCSMSAD